MVELPGFNEEGVLPAGGYPLTLEELAVSLLVNGPVEASNWDKDWRARLVENLSRLVRQLWQVGIEEICIIGSFVTDKPHPNDIDGYFICDVERLSFIQETLNGMEPRRIWIWDRATRTRHRDSKKPGGELPMWHSYRIDLYPEYGQLFGPPGMVDQHGQPLLIPSAFRMMKDGRQKGVVNLIHS